MNRGRHFIINMFTVLDYFLHMIIHFFHAFDFRKDHGHWFHKLNDKLEKVYTWAYGETEETGNDE